MENCANCKRGISCGCQKRKASDGAACCSHCLNAYEAQLRAKKSKDNSLKFISAHVTKKK